MSLPISATHRALLLDEIEPDELNARATRCVQLVSFEEVTEPAPSWDTTTVVDNPPFA